jgi:hypothetical protein
VTTDQIREQVLERQRNRWAQLKATPGALGKWFGSIFAKSPAEGFFIVEHEAVDPETLLCTGAILRAWRLDDQGLRLIDPAEVEPGKTIGRWWQYQLVRLFISPDMKQVFLNELEGPKQGTLMSMQPRESNGQVGLKPHLAVPARRVL